MRDDSGPRQSGEAGGDSDLLELHPERASPEGGLPFGVAVDLLQPSRA